MGAKAGERLENLLTEFDVQHDVKIYPRARHGFMNNHATADQTLFLRFLARSSGTRYDQEATVDARRRIAAFFREHLRPNAPSST
ncbi:MULTISPECIES: dienelactone hydrolase family protein [unclassified Phycicoccus]|uniref:dienelactone hydrolase family protein n=1 Tax=unclassified Phycicoccus TaxID=2637926 RepID=UPI00210119A8|nr:MULTISPECIES: dienelactone hydrolase family protein [unclassified Phycicoccus]